LHPATLANKYVNSNFEGYDETQMSKMYQIAKAAFFDINRLDRLKYIFSLRVHISSCIDKRRAAFT